MFELLKQMVDLYGATGHESGVADAVEKLLEGKADSITRDALGNLICVRHAAKGRQLHGAIRHAAKRHRDEVRTLVPQKREHGGKHRAAGREEKRGRQHRQPGGMHAE